MEELYLINAQIKSIYNIINNRTYKVGDILHRPSGSGQKIISFKLKKGKEAANVLVITERGEIEIEKL